ARSRKVQPYFSNLRAIAHRAAKATPWLSDANCRITSPSSEPWSLFSRVVSSRGSAIAHLQHRSLCGQGIIEATRQQLTGARRFDNVGRAVTPELRPFSIERYKEVQPLAGISIHGGEQRRIGDLQIRLIKRGLRRVLRESLFETVAL